MKNPPTETCNEYPDGEAPRYQMLHVSAFSQCCHKRNQHEDEFKEVPWPLDDRSCCVCLVHHLGPLEDVRVLRRVVDKSLVDHNESMTMPEFYSLLI